MSFASIGNRRTFRSGVKHISTVDAKIRRLIKKHGPIEFRTRDFPFESLVRSIIGQQLSGMAARSIYAKLKVMVQSEHIEPQTLHSLSTLRLRKAGVSPQKIRYLKDLSARVIKGKLDLEDLRNRSDDEVIEVLDEVKGIGPWTAHMFLLFTLGRTDVLPVDDLGIRTAVRHVYGLRQLPSAGKIRKLACKWHPYCSVASLYLWRAKDSRD